MKLSLLLDECGIDPRAKWFIAEGADAPHLMRSIPLAKGLDDAMIALYQNGEPLMPGNGFPMRLLLPGYEGNMNVKFLRRIKLVAESGHELSGNRRSIPSRCPRGKATTSPS